MSVIKHLRFYIYKKNNHQPSGFTLVELLLSLAIIAIITGMTIPIYQSFQVKNDLDLTSAILAQSLRRAQLLAEAVAADSNWGVYLQEEKMTLFKGDSYLFRDQTADEDFSIAKSITPGILREIIFAKFTGLPLTVGTMVLTSTNNEVKNITINSQGMVNY